MGGAEVPWSERWATTEPDGDKELSRPTRKLFFEVLKALLTRVSGFLKCDLTFGPGVLPLANCWHGVLVHWWGLKEETWLWQMIYQHKWHIFGTAVFGSSLRKKDKIFEDSKIRWENHQQTVESIMKIFVILNCGWWAQLWPDNKPDFPSKIVCPHVWCEN